MTIVFLLVVIVILLYTRQAGRDYTLGIGLLIAAFTWLAIEIHLLRILADLFALAVQHWLDVVVALGAAILLIVPVIMIYITLHDRLDDRALSPQAQHSPGAVRGKFDRRVATMIALGYDRTQAEVTAVRLMKRDLMKTGSQHRRDG